MERILIIAPHVDDEMIGCWSVMNEEDVEITILYLYELSVERRKEAENLSRMLASPVILPVFAGRHVEGEDGGADDFAYLFHQHYSRIYVPSRRDWHPDHKRANAMFRAKATHFYSVDMGKGKLLPDAERKRSYLGLTYPSQASLWERDHKYWLFEDIQTVDHVHRMTLYAAAFQGYRSMEIQVDLDDTPKATTVLMQAYHSMIDVLDALIAAGVQGKIVVTDPNTNQSLESY